MWRLIKAEWRNDIHDRQLLLMVICTVVICFLFWNGLQIKSTSHVTRDISERGFRAVALSNGWSDESIDEENTDRFFQYYMKCSFSRMLREVNPIMFFSLYAAAYLVGTKFTRRTINMPIYCGYTRLQILCAALLHYFSVAVTTFLMALVAFLVVKFGAAWCQMLGTVFFWRCLALWFYLSLSALVIQFAAAFVMQNVFGTLLTNFVLLILLAVMPSSPRDSGVIGGRLFDLYPIGMMQKEVLWDAERMIGGEACLALIFVPTLLIVCSVAIAYISYRRSSLI